MVEVVDGGGGSILVCSVRAAGRAPIVVAVLANNVDILQSDRQAAIAPGPCFYAVIGGEVMRATTI